MIDKIVLIIGAIILWVAAYIAGKNLFCVKAKLTLRKVIIILISSTVLVCINMVSEQLINGIIKLASVYILQCIYFQIMFKKEFSKCMIAALLWYLCLMIVEIVVVVLASAVLDILDIPLDSLKNNFFINSSIALITMLTITLLRGKLTYFINNNGKYIGRSIIIIIVTVLLIIGLIGFKRPMRNWEFDFEFVFTMVVLGCLCIIGFYLIKQKSDLEKTSGMYNKVVEYSKMTNKLLEDYRVVNHEHKNQLSIIRTMANKTNKELIEYVDSLLDKKNVIKYEWLSDLNNLPLEGLKGLMNYKFLEMEENKVNTTVIISKEIAKVKLDKLSSKRKDALYSIIGVYLDNAMQAAMKSKEKEVSVEIYKDKKEIIILISNTYKGKVDINKVSEYGYTTKGKNHGVGLYLVSRILNQDKMYSEKKWLANKRYVQELRIDLTVLK